MMMIVVTVAESCCREGSMELVTCLVLVRIDYASSVRNVLNGPWSENIRCLEAGSLTLAVHRLCCTGNLLNSGELSNCNCNPRC